jgi:hypothetical protein
MALFVGGLLGGCASSRDRPTLSSAGGDVGAGNGFTATGKIAFIGESDEDGDVLYVLDMNGNNLPAY